MITKAILTQTNKKNLTANFLKGREKMKFSKDGIEVFYSAEKEYGGFNHFTAKRIFRNRLMYLDVYWHRKFKFEVSHNKEENYYQCTYHNHIWIGFIMISYGSNR